MAIATGGGGVGGGAVAERASARGTGGGAALAVGWAVATGTTVGLGAATDGAGSGVGRAVGEGNGRGVWGSIVAIATGARPGGASGAAVDVTTASGVGSAGRCPPLRCMNTPITAPMASPATMTPAPIAIVASQLRPPDGGRGGSGRRRRGGVDIAARLQRSRQEASLAGAKRPPMIRVSVPIDLSAVVTNASAAFALATPLRLADIVATAVVVSLGRRAPQDKRERAVRRTLDGLHAGEFVVEIDGRIYTDAQDVVVCAGVIALRFFARRTYRRAA
jgi:hypothetical protein